MDKTTETQDDKALAFSPELLYYQLCRNYRSVAQLGRALRSGRRGRKFESCRIDFNEANLMGTRFFGVLFS